MCIYTYIIYETEKILIAHFDNDKRKETQNHSVNSGELRQTDTYNRHMLIAFRWIKRTD